MTLVIPWYCWPPRLRHRRRDRVSTTAMSAATSFSHLLCIVAITMAFMVGIVVGILLPVYVPSTFLPPPSGRIDDQTPDALWRLQVSKDMEQKREQWRTSQGGFWDPVTVPSHENSASPKTSDSVKMDLVRSLTALGSGQSLLIRLATRKEAVTNRPSMERVASGWPQLARPFRSQQWEDGATTDQNDVTERAVSGPSGERPLAPSSIEPSTLVEGGVYWSGWVERLLPQGFSGQEVREWTEYAGNATVVKVLEGCGRMQNRLLVFGDGTKSCCRYRQNNDQIQGEIFSFYLAQLLGLTGLPPATLGLLHGHEGQWQAVRGQLTLAQWNEQKPVVMTKFVDDLVPAYIPRHFRGDGQQEVRRLHPTEEDLAGLHTDQLRELAQWSDLVIFDYLTANLDRVVNNMYNKQWNPDMMAAPAHNLARTSDTGLLVFLDNESGLLHGYRLLDKYESYHRAMLDGLCLFRRSTASAVRRLHRSADVGLRLKRALHESQRNMVEWLPLLPDKSVKILRERLARVVHQISECERLFGANIGGADERFDYDATLTKPSAEY